MPEVVGPPPRKSIYATHGFAVAATMEDGVKRSVSVHLLENGHYNVAITTDWPDAQPLTTSLSISRAGLQILADALLEAVHNMHSWPSPQPENRYAET